MSLLRDSKYVKNLAEVSGFKEPTEEACRFILADVELLLRDVIYQANKYTRKFKKSMITKNEINFVLEDKNLSYILSGTKVDSINQYELSRA